MTVLILRRGKYLHRNPMASSAPVSFSHRIGKTQFCNLRKTLAVNPEDHSLFADPNLTTAEKRETDKSAHIEFLAIIDELHSGTIDLTVFRIQNFSPLIFLSLFRQTPQNGHAHHRLITPATSHFSQFGFGSSPGLGKIFSTLPSYCPFTSLMRTKPRGRPVLSSIVFQRPSGERSAA